MEFEETCVAYLYQRRHRLLQQAVTKLSPQLVEIDPFIQTQAEEERLLKGFAVPDNIHFGMRRVFFRVKYPKRVCFGCLPEISIKIARLVKSYRLLTGK